MKMMTKVAFLQPFSAANDKFICDLTDLMASAVSILFCADHVQKPRNFGGGTKALTPSPYLSQLRELKPRRVVASASSSFASLRPQNHQTAFGAATGGQAEQLRSPVRVLLV